MRAETLRPFPNRPPRGRFGRTAYALRRWFDFSVWTVTRDLAAFLGERGDERLLEIGGGLRPYAHLVPGSRHWSLDPYGLERSFGYDAKTIKYDGARFPFKTGSFDALFHTEVLEHVYDTRGFLSECARVLRPGGRMFFTVPFAARYHYQPHDYWRFTPSSLEKLLGEQGFRVDSLRARGGAFTVILNKIMVLAVALVAGRRSDGRRRRVLPVLAFPCAALVLPISAVLGQFALRSRWSPGSDDCLGYSVACVRQAGNGREGAKGEAGRLEKLG